MTPPSLLAVGLPAEAFRWQGLIGPILFGTGVWYLLMQLPFGRPGPDLGERLARLDVEARMREAGVAEGRPFFANRVLEALLRPVLDDLGRGVRAVLGLFGFGGGADTERGRRAVRPGRDIAQVYGG